MLDIDHIGASQARARSWKSKAVGDNPCLIDDPVKPADLDNLGSVKTVQYGLLQRGGLPEKM